MICKDNSVFVCLFLTVHFDVSVNKYHVFVYTVHEEN
jgi:hypothetical protein